MPLHYFQPMELRNRLFAPLCHSWHYIPSLWAWIPFALLAQTGWIQISGHPFGDFPLLSKFRRGRVHLWLRLRSNSPHSTAALARQPQTAGLGTATLAPFYLADPAALVSVRIANKTSIHSKDCVMWAEEQKEIVAQLETGKQALPNQTGTVGVNERLRIKPFFLAFCIVLLISKRDVISPGLWGLK